MEFKKHANPAQEILHETKDCYQRWRCYFVPELKFNLLAVLYAMMFSHAGNTLAPFLLSVDSFICVFVSFLLLFCVILVAYDPLDPTGNITIKWDVMSWTPDGYVVSVVSI